MLLDKAEIPAITERIKAVFPRFGSWKHNNEINHSHPGFAVWGQFISEQKEYTARRFFITFTAYETTWKGHLTIGQPCYFWSSANYGDAHLVDTPPCATLEEAITELKRQIADLFTACLESNP